MKLVLFLSVVLAIACAIKYLPWAIYGLEELDKGLEELGKCFSDTKSDKK